MKTSTLSQLVLVLVLIGLTAALSLAEGPFGTLGFSGNTTIIEGPGPDEDCPGELDCHWDGSVENGFCWQYAGVVPPDYGAFAECYDNRFVCAAQFYFTRGGGYYYGSYTADVYVWNGNETEGPGNVICSLTGVDPGPVAYWPECSTHVFDLNCQTGGDHFVGYWGNWPGEPCAWYLCADVDGFPGCGWTKIAPGIGYPTGWAPLDVVPLFIGTVGLCEWYINEPTSSQETTWGRIKGLY
jgi:hypothetical protein